VIRAVQGLEMEEAVLNGFTTVADANKCKMYMKNFGEFFNDQIEHAGCIFFSHTDNTTDAKLAEAVKLVREHNATAALVTTPSDKLDITALIDAFEKRSTLEEQLKKLAEEEVCPECGHHHHHDEHRHHEHHHEHGEHHHHHDEHHHHGEHHHHDHGEECHCHECDEHHHEHHHDHHEHHHHHHADEVFTSWGRETVKKFSKERINNILTALENSDKYGFVIRAKGIVECECGKWIHFDYVPGEPDVRIGSSATIGKICVIGSKIDENAISELFEV
jgi:G3E family GTPase